MTERNHAAELARAEQRLRQSEELYRHVIELSSLIPWAADKDGRVIAVGERWRDWTGVDPCEAMGSHWLDFAHPDEAPGLFASWMHAVETGSRFETEWRVRGADGNYRWCHARAAKRPETGAEEVVWYGTLEDVQERRTAAEAFQQSQAELAHVSRLSAMGAMASAIAHDLNQPLTATAQYVRGCKRLAEQVEGPDKPDLMEGLEDADRNIVRASDIVRRVREFVTRGTVDARQEAVADLVENACRLARADASAQGIMWHLQMDCHRPVLADRTQIQQVLVNLIGNAVEALEGQPRREILIRAREGPQGLCEVAVSDTGPGIAPDAAARMFDPLFTTRQDGMGLGLSISRTIVEAHGGAIWRDANVRQGTTIRFTLPLVPEREAA